MRFLPVVCCLLLANATVAFSQEAEQPSSADELLQGLLELVPNPPDQTNASKDATGKILLDPEDVGLSQADLHSVAQTPLESIRQSMLVSAGLLRRGINDDLLTLQDDILDRLDDLIEQLDSEKQNNGSSSKSDTSNAGDKAAGNVKSQQSSNASQTQSEDAQPEDLEGGNSKEQFVESDGPLSGGPSNVGPKRIAELKLSARQAYQEQIWGQLPERVRASMQSKMVEEFLPSHREQIEIYYRRLMERYRENDGKL